VTGHRCLLAVVLVVVANFGACLLVSAGSFAPLGDDFVWHRSLASVYASRGLLAGLSASVSRGVALNGLPYPPLFHLFLAPWAALGFVDSFGLVAQSLLFSLVLSVFALIAWRWRGCRAALFVVLFLSASFGFFDRCFQVIPQSFEVLLLGLCLLLFLRGRLVLALLCGALMVLLHAPVSWLLLLPFFVVGLLLRGSDEVWRDFWFPVGLFWASLPVLLFLLPFVPGALSTMSGSLCEQKRLFLQSPLSFSVAYAGPLFFVGLVALLRLRWGCLDWLGRFMAVLLLSVFVMFPLWPDRAFTYAVVPLAFLSFPVAGHRFWGLVVGFGLLGVVLKFVFAFLVLAA